MSNSKKILKFFLLAAFLLAVPLQASANTYTDGRYSTVFDETGNSIYLTAWIMNVGDEVLTENNKRYEIIAVNGEKAIARLIGEINLAYYDPPAPADSTGFLEPSVAQAQAQSKIAVYHTHSDESYVPTDGKESIDGGGTIYKVGAAFKAALEKNGMQVFFSDAKHDPHDDMAYERSRRTALNLIKNDKPDAVFDLHRDAVPPEVYKGNVDGQDITKVQLVVGKHGPTGKQIEEYALKIKAAADKKHPGLVKGIFF
ncbi:MAG: stage II sporulation protein P, partial [Sporomusaceae bacterium]|nr:stage II sporulation protein P [Sporomusaceae bacterium]